MALTNLESDAVLQPQLPLDHPDTAGLDAAMDALAARFGARAVTRASLLRTGEGLSVPLLED